VFGPTGGASFGAILAAVTYAANVGCDVANLSLGSYPFPKKGNGSFYGGVLNETMTYANSQGTLLVVAAGNDGADLQHDGNVISIPAEGAQALAVSSTTSVGFDPLTGTADNPGTKPASYTNYGTNAVTLGAPGGDTPAGGGVSDLVYNAIPLATAEAFGFPRPYAYLAGTSMAAPQVAGAAALVAAENPDYDANQVEAALKQAASVPSGFDKAFYGAGFLDVEAALDG
jgi:subtilisin family serine protease